MDYSVGIHGGGTQKLEEIQDSIREMVKQSNKALHIDDFIFQGGELNSRLNECFEEWRNFPVYRYTIKTLCLFLGYRCGAADAELERLFREKELGIPFSEESKHILEHLTERLIWRIKELCSDSLRNELLEKFPEQKIMDNLLELEQDFFLEFMAPILELNREEVNIFLLRAFKRDELCNFIPTEYLLGLAIDVKEQLKSGSMIEILYELKHYYEIISPDSLEETVSSGIGTQYIFDKSDAVLMEIKNERGFFELKDYPEVSELLKWYKSLDKPSARNRSEAFEKLFREVVVLYTPELEDYLRVIQQEKKRRGKVQHREGVSVPVTVWYQNPGKEAKYIEAGTIFYGANCEYCLGERAELPSKEYVQICVHVVPHPANSHIPMQGKIPQFLPENAELSILSGNAEKNGSPILKNVRVVPINKVAAENTANIKVEAKLNTRDWARPRWTEEKDTKRNGFVVMEIMAGEEFPEGVCFSYNGFRFIPTEGVGEKFYPKKTITVYVNRNMIVSDRVTIGSAQETTKEGKKIKKKIYVLDGTDSITRMSVKMNEVIRISNQNNRVTAPGEMFERKAFEQGKRLVLQLEEENLVDIEEEKKRYTDRELFQQYMYGQKDYDIVTNLDIEKTRKIGLDMLTLSSRWLEDTVIRGDSEWFVSLEEYRQRNIMLVLLFLRYIKKNDTVIKISRERFIRNFNTHVASRMTELRFEPLYFGYPIDCLLMFLLAACVPEDLCDTLRVIYKEKLCVLRKKMNGNEKNSDAVRCL